METNLYVYLVEGVCYQKLFLFFIVNTREGKYVCEIRNLILNSSSYIAQNDTK